jgi:hypothetical protein
MIPITGKHELRNLFPLVYSLDTCKPGETTVGFLSSVLFVDFGNRKKLRREVRESADKRRGRLGGTILGAVYSTNIICLNTLCNNANVTVNCKSWNCCLILSSQARSYSATVVIS